MAPKVSVEYKQKKRKAILDSALSCFAEKGYVQTTIDDIARHAKASKGAIYHYFNSKEEIYLELLHSNDEEAFETISQQLEQFSSAKDKLIFWFNLFRDYPKHLQSQDLIRIHLEFFIQSVKDEKLKPLMENRFQLFITSLEEIIEKGIYSGEFKKDFDVRSLVQIFWALRDGIGLHFLLLDDSKAYEAVWKTVREMFIQFIEKRDS